LLLDFGVVQLLSQVEQLLSQKNHLDLREKELTIDALVGSQLLVITEVELVATFQHNSKRLQAFSITILSYPEYT